MKKPKTIPPRVTAAKLKAATRELEAQLITNAVRGPQQPRLSGKALEIAKRGGFA